MINFNFYLYYVSNLRFTSHERCSKTGKTNLNYKMQKCRMRIEEQLFTSCLYVE